MRPTSSSPHSVSRLVSPASAPVASAPAAFSASRAALALSLFASIALTGACSGGDSTDGPMVTTTDATPPLPDADNTVYDAAPCAGDVCDGICVDTSSDPLNCGACGETCASPGQICTGTTPCECPAPFVPATLGGTGFDQFQAQGPAIFAIAPSIGTTLDIAAIAYDLTLELEVDYELSIGAGLTLPTVAAGYDVDVNNFTAHTAYGATAGTIRFTQICAEGISGSITGVEFAEVNGVLDPTPLEGGCTMNYKTVAFNIGSCPTP